MPPMVVGCGSTVRLGTALYGWDCIVRMGTGDGDWGLPDFYKDSFHPMTLRHKIAEFCTSTAALNMESRLSNFDVVSCPKC